ncbi:hypothetical protein BUALT_Bualt09G0031100 [Buddleja alternifolia]|uniref:PPM-type phosphatase domain-containing protein n=1 Tax=Buddleja alternifolia TaxID=168488 RepID=A0AAV6X0Y0_9LAMI|nr:hypothetical protein BUALT_Bualt09G0031100 [Buddleja alternifolia]
MEGHKILLLVLGVILCAISSCSCSCSCSSLGIGATEGAGSPSFTLSPEVLDRIINRAVKTNISLDDITMNCQFSTMKGRRQYQEDRIFCNLDNVIPFHGYLGSKMVKVGVVAVFDGHIGEEASDMASKIFESEFLLNTYRVNHQSEIGYGYFVPWSGPDSTLRRDDYVKAVEENLASGTTAVIALLVDNQILVANVGDSKALLCSKNTQSSQDGGSQHLSPIQLTRDHNALRDDERARIEAGGGYIIDWDVPLVMGHFPMTRAIGDVPLKRYGIIAEPEVTGWQPLSANDSYLVVASDGIFESLSPEDVCNLLDGEGDNKSSIKHFPSQPASAADFIVQTAYVKGSSDNLSVVVVPLFSKRSTESIQDAI